LTTTQQVSTIGAHPKMLNLFIQQQMSGPNDQNNKSVIINSTAEFLMTNFGPISNHDTDGQNIVYDMFGTINHHPTKEIRNKHFGHCTAH
jgi:hypothetical protein